MDLTVFLCGFGCGIGLTLLYAAWDSAKSHRAWMKLTEGLLDDIRERLQEDSWRNN